MKKQYWFKQERTMRYSKPKLLQKNNLDSEKTVGGKA